MALHVLPIIMAGGSGTRLWPLSRALYPKQFLALSGDQTLFQQATQRLMDLSGNDIHVAPPCIVGNEEHRFMVLDQLRELGIEPGAVLLEPSGRNTAPALTLAALFAQQASINEDADPILIVTPADQTVMQPEAFKLALRQAVAAAADGSIVTLGIVPDRPETGFGYIRATGDGSVKAVAAFVEKPNLEVAKRYLVEGGYFWNSGMFVLRASTWLKALHQHRPDIDTATRTAWEERTTDARFIRPGKAAFNAIPSESIDYAVMEPATAAAAAAAGQGDSIRMVPLDAGWSDLGAWDAVWQVSAQDANGNARHGDVLIENSKGTLVHATSRLVSAIGLDNIVIVETPDAVLVADRAQTQDVKLIVNALQKAKRSEGSLHRQVHRPWGWYDSIDHGARFQVKRIMVKPGASLSLQMHHHRAEHWIVVSGTAEVTNGDTVSLLTENQSTYIPLGTTHRLRNPGTIPLEIIEVQSGSYLGEDDIVRFDDTYGRQ